MELNNLVFPYPTPSYTAENLKGRLFYVPKFAAPSVPAAPCKASYSVYSYMSNPQIKKNMSIKTKQLSKVMTPEDDVEDENSFNL
jgi:hypothetical protein